MNKRYRGGCILEQFAPGEFSDRFRQTNSQVPTSDADYGPEEQWTRLSFLNDNPYIL